MPFEIRPATVRDIETIADFNWQLAAESEGTVLDGAIARAGAEAMLSDPEKGTYFLAWENDRIVGQLMITKEWSDWRNGWLWWIQSVYTRKQDRGRGVFRQLYQHIHALARRAGNVVGIRLYVDRENAAGKATYNSVGMKPTAYEVFEAPVCPQKT